LGNVELLTFLHPLENGDSYFREELLKLANKLKLYNIRVITTLLQLQHSFGKVDKVLI